VAAYLHHVDVGEWCGLVDNLEEQVARSFGEFEHQLWRWPLLFAVCSSSLALRLPVLLCWLSVANAFPHA
jgi:hypothetical protein